MSMTQTVNEHEIRLTFVLERARQKNIKFNKDIRKFRLEKTKHLGHYIVL